MKAPDFIFPGFRISSDFQSQSLARRSEGESVEDSTQRKTVRFSLCDGEKDKSNRQSAARTDGA
jgi:hypothetical protein